jgi:TatD DNase family protein
VIDTHCHLTFPEFCDPDRCVQGGIDGTLRLAASHGVTGCITISTTLPDARKALSIAREHDRVWCSAGVHPLYADQGPHDWSIAREVGADPKCVAWGELGLDRHYSEPAFDLQIRVLEEQLAFIRSERARGVVKPIILHCREAFSDLIPILAASELPADRMVFHCFTGDERDMKALLDFGACVSFTGVITYKNAEAVRSAAKLAPADRVMVETDAPFLSPDPHRSTRPCQPWMVSVTLAALAQAQGRSFDHMHDIVNANTARFFGIHDQPEFAS